MIKRNVTVLKWFSFFLDFTPHSLIAVLYFSQITGSFALGLSVLSIERISASLFELPTGVLSDFLGRRGTIIFGAVANLICMIIYALSGSFIMLVIGALFEGLASSFFSGNNDALLYESIDDPENHFAETKGKISSLFQIGLATSALLGGFLAFSTSFRFVMWISVIPQFISLFLTFFIIEPKIHQKNIGTNIFSHIKESFYNFIHNKRLRAISLTSASQYGIEETLYTFAPAFIVLLWPTWALGIVRSANNFISAASFWFAGRVIKKWGEVKAFIVGNLSNRFFAILATIIPTVFSPILLTFSEIFFGVITVAQSSLGQKEFNDHQRATMGSLGSLLNSLFFAVFAFLFGLIADQIGPARSLLLGNILLLLVIFLFWSYFKKEKAQGVI